MAERYWFSRNKRMRLEVVFDYLRSIHESMTAVGVKDRGIGWDVLDFLNTGEHLYHFEWAARDWSIGDHGPPVTDIWLVVDDALSVVMTIALPEISEYRVVTQQTED